MVFVLLFCMFLFFFLILLVLLFLFVCLECNTFVKNVSVMLFHYLCRSICCWFLWRKWITFRCLLLSISNVITIVCSPFLRLLYDNWFILRNKSTRKHTTTDAHTDTRTQLLVYVHLKRELACKRSRTTGRILLLYWCVKKEKCQSSCVFFLFIYIYIFALRSILKYSIFFLRPFFLCWLRILSRR